MKGVGGIVVSIAAFQAVDPGSIPGRRNVLIYFIEKIIKRKVFWLLFFLHYERN